MDVLEHSTRQWTLAVAQQEPGCRQNQQFAAAYVGECWTTARLDSSKNSGLGDSERQNEDALANHACTFLPLCIFRLSSTTWIVVMCRGISWSRYSRKAMNSTRGLALISLPPHQASCVCQMQQIDWVPLCVEIHARLAQVIWALAGKVGALRVRGCSRGFFIDTQHHVVSLKSAGIQPTNFWNRFGKRSKKDGWNKWQTPFGLSLQHTTDLWGCGSAIYLRRGTYLLALLVIATDDVAFVLRWWLGKMRLSVEAEMLPTTPVATLLACQFRAVPLWQRTPLSVRPFAGHLD